MLAKNKQLENKAIESIITLLTSEEIKSKSEAETMALILETISAACDVVPRKENDEDSRKLQEFNSALDHYVKQFRGQEALTINNGGKDLQSCIVTLDKIRKSLKNETDGEWKANRMLSFIDDLAKVGVRFEKKRRVCLWGMILFLGGCLYGMGAGDFYHFNSIILSSLMVGGGALFVYGKYIM